MKLLLSVCSILIQDWNPNKNTLMFSIKSKFSLVMHYGRVRIKRRHDVKCDLQFEVEKLQQR